ncbi:MAG: LysM peptidoglycan-binding domain-containing protein [Ruminococcus sp.]|nr:LysM peptidoglycan-binding domain-containing protein [Ruminococcus sp.]
METTSYTVRKGNTLFGIAQFFGTTVDKILKLNNIADPNTLYVGQTIIVPVDTEETSGYVYVVRPGDTLWSIAQRFKTSVEEIARKNGMYNPDILYPGTKLYI